MLVWLVGCGEAEVEVAEFAELCGVAGPVRVLEHAEDEVAYFAPRQVGARLFLEIARFELRPGQQPFVPTSDSRLWTTGLCGESPTPLDERYEELFVVDRWPELALVCDEDGDVSSLAATGPLAPHVVFPELGCRPLWSPLGAISRDYGDRLMFFPFPADPRRDTVAPIELPGVAEVDGSEPKIAVAGDELLVLRPDHELVSIDLNDRTVTRVQAGVGAFVASPSGRYVLWAGVYAADGVSSGVHGVVLMDRETGVSAGLGEAYLSRHDIALRWAEQGFVYVALAGEPPRIYRVPDLGSAEIPWEYRLSSHVMDWLGPLPDGRWILTRVADSTLHYLDTVSGEISPMFTRPGQVLGREADATQVLEVFYCCDRGGADDEAAVWLVPDDGSEPTKIAGRSTLFGRRVGEGSWVSPVALDARRGARLVRADTMTGAAQQIDDHVFPTIVPEDRQEPGIVRYSVQDGARSGVWQVRLPAE